MRRLTVTLFALVFLSGCFGSLNDDFVKGSRKLFDDIAPRYRDYVEAESVPESVKKSYLRPMAEWEKLIKDGEKIIGED